MENESPRTLQEAIVHFDEYANCHRFMLDLRWPEGTVTCPRCGSARVVYLAKPRVWKCYEAHDHAKFSLKTGTIFEDSPLPLCKWLTAVWMNTNAKNGVSSSEIHRCVGVTQKTAWFMLQRIRLAMQDGSLVKADGQVEVDETFIGGKGTYVSVEPYHLFRYLDEQTFRFNERKDERGDSGRFGHVMRNTTGRRLTYKKLTGNAL